MTKYRSISVILLTVGLAGCGDGGGSLNADGTYNQDPRPPVVPNTPEPTLPEISVLVGDTQLVPHDIIPSQKRGLEYDWVIAPRVDLPENGTDGLSVERPNIGSSFEINFEIDPALKIRLEGPGWENNPAAIERLEQAERDLWRITQLAYNQWVRHLNYDPEPLLMEVGTPKGHIDFNAWYNPAEDKVVLSAEWLNSVYDNTQDRYALKWPAIEELFWVISHEAGHQFKYHHPTGRIENDDIDHYHAPYGSGSVISYDANQGRSVRYNVTEEDIQHIPNAIWNDTADEYTVSTTSHSMSIDSYGIWIVHNFHVSGMTDPGYRYGGDLIINDNIQANGWVRGIASENVTLTGDATYSGQDNFLGVDLDPGFAGALLRADANLTYQFNGNTLNAHINNFEAHYSWVGPAQWHDHTGDFSYTINCDGGECSNDVVQTNWYANDAGDPIGFVGGTVSDTANEYVGSFVAEKD